MSTHNITARDTLRREIEKGGKLAPCPQCGVPRVQRSNYVRCCGCSLNWMDGENLDCDPRIERYEKMKAAQPKLKARE